MSILGNQSALEMSISTPSTSPNDTMHINSTVGKSDQVQHEERINQMNTIERVNQINPLLDNHPISHLDQYRIQLYNYAIQAERIRLSQQYVQTYGGSAAAYQTPNTNRVVNYFHPRFQINNEEPKPQHSYIGLIAMAILSNPDMKLVLSDIYQYILDNYTYFRSRGPGWRNSIRHNLSLNDCFIKAGRSANGKGHYWSIHPANVDDFKKGDFRRRKAQRKVRKHMGLSVDDDNDSNSPPPPNSPPLNFTNFIYPFQYFPQSIIFPSIATQCVSRKRQFDVDSLLAPDQPKNEFEIPKKIKPSLDSDELRRNNEIRDFRDAIELNSIRKLNELRTSMSDTDARMNELRRNKELNDMMRHRHNALNNRHVSEFNETMGEHSDINDNDTRRINEISDTNQYDTRSDIDFRRHTTINDENNTKHFNEHHETIKKEYIDQRDGDKGITEPNNDKINQFNIINNNNQCVSKERKKSNESEEDIDVKWEMEQKSDKLISEESYPSERKIDVRDRKISNASDDADVDGEMEPEYGADIDVVNNNKIKESLMLQKYYHSIALRRLEIYQQFQNSAKADQ